MKISNLLLSTGSQSKRFSRWNQVLVFLKNCYVYEYFACTYVCASCMRLVSSEVRSLGTEVTDGC